MNNASACPLPRLNPHAYIASSFIASATIKRRAHLHAPKAEPPAFRAARSPRSRSRNLLKPTESRPSTVFELPPAPMEAKRAVAVLLVVLVAAVAVSTGGVDGARRVVEWPQTLAAADSDPKTTTTAACLMARLNSTDGWRPAEEITADRVQLSKTPDTVPRQLPKAQQAALQHLTTCPAVFFSSVEWIAFTISRLTSICRRKPDNKEMGNGRQIVKRRTET
ncbi:hypothetical protein B296_00037049 [Ensete ventricosum]|uniref:Uncharacterized protein n=1 Tax=Ensete ventricosum TaxID=4639 RepID=A0A426XVC9_ENSVE|nr:hypothetical protein B296_00037049 [Ensete ventricosum]